MYAYVYEVEISVRLYVCSVSSKGDCMGCAPNVTACVVVFFFFFLICSDTIFLKNH